jgi:hypothetical protein
MAKPTPNGGPAVRIADSRNEKNEKPFGPFGFELEEEPQ